MARIVLRFHELVVNDQVIPIEAAPVAATVRVVNDFEIVGSAFEAAAGALLGTAIGAASGNKAEIRRGVVYGGLIGSVPLVYRKEITVVLDKAVYISA